MGVELCVQSELSTKLTYGRTMADMAIIREGELARTLGNILALSLIQRLRSMFIALIHLIFLIIHNFLL